MTKPNKPYDTTSRLDPIIYVFNGVYPKNKKNWPNNPI